MKSIRAVAFLVLAVAPAHLPAQEPRPAADSAWVRGDRETARSLYLRCISENGTDTVALFRLALMASWNGHHEESIAWLDRLLAIHPEDRDAAVARARAVAATGRLDEAIATVDSILLDWPDETGALVARARFATWRRDTRLAERLWRRALAADPHHVEARAGLAGTLRQTGRLIEARQEAAIALAAAPDDIDVRNAADRVELSFRPRVRSAVVVEDDSDGNAVTSMSAGGSIRASDRLDLAAEAWTREAGLEGAFTAVRARGGRVGLSIDAASGWRLRAYVGALVSTEPGARGSASFALSAVSPADRTTVVTVDASRTPLDYTLPLLRNRVVATGASIALDARRGRDWDFGAVTGIATWNATAVESSSRRTHIGATVRRRLTDGFAVTLGARAFGFDRDIDGGFFDPEAYGLVDAALSWIHEPGVWLLDAQLAPGLQRIGSDGEVTAAVRAVASTTWQPRPGRQLGLRVTFANAGIERVAPGDGASYRYASAALSFAWWF